MTRRPFFLCVALAVLLVASACPQFQVRQETRGLRLKLDASALALGDLTEATRETLRLTADLSGLSIVVLEDQGDGFWVAEDLGINDVEGDLVTVHAELTGALDASRETVLLASADGEVTLTFQDGVQEETIAMVVSPLDDNRNGRPNLDDLRPSAENEMRPCDPSYPELFRLSTRSLQLPSGLLVGGFSRQVVVVESVEDEPFFYQAEVVAGPGMRVELLEVGAEKLQADTERSLAARELVSGSEDLLAVTFSPANDYLARGALYVTGTLDRCGVELADAVRLFANVDRDLQPADPAHAQLAPSGALVDLFGDEVDVYPAEELWSGRPLDLPNLPSSVGDIDGDEVGIARVIDVPPNHDLSLLLDDLEADLFLKVFELGAGDEPTAVIDLVSDRGAQSAESVVVRGGEAGGRFLVTVGLVEPAALVNEEAPALSLAAHLYNGPVIEGAPEPASGPVDGLDEAGDPVTVVIHGRRFEPDAQVFFNEAQAAGCEVTPLEISCALPPGALPPGENPATIRVENPGDPRQIAALPEAFLYEPKGSNIDALSPDRASTEGGPEINIFGTGFANRFTNPEIEEGGTNPTVVFTHGDNEVRVTQLTYLSSGHLRLTAPALADAGGQEVGVVVVNYDSAGNPKPSNSIALLYNAPEPVPEVESIAPSSGSTTGGFTVSITGTGFTANSTVHFGTLPAALDPDASSDTVLVVTAPAVALGGSVPVIVTNGVGQSATNQPAFTYVDALSPQPLGTSPAVAHASVQGEIISLVGLNLELGQFTGAEVLTSGDPVAATLLDVSSTSATLRVDAPLPAEAGLQVRLFTDTEELLFPPFRADPPVGAGQAVIAGEARHNESFTVSVQGSQLFPAQLEGVRIIGGPNPVDLTPALAQEQIVQVVIPADTLPAGTYGLALVYVDDTVVDVPGTLEVIGDCGNGSLELGEVCDGLDLNQADCQSLGFFGGTLACDPVTCTYDTLGCNGCGNDAVDPGEQCDGADLDGRDCSDFAPLNGGTLGCTPGCTFDWTGCYQCGNGLLEPGELCDDDQFAAGTDCASEAGLAEGSLSCGSSCDVIDTGACYECDDGQCSEFERLGGLCLGNGQECVGCGDATCDDVGGETCSSCPQDCGACPPYTGEVLTTGPGLLGAVLSTLSLEVRVRDDLDNGIEGATVFFTPPAGAQVSPPSIVTDASGLGTVSVTLPRAPGAVSVGLTWQGPPNASIDTFPTSFEATATALPAGTLVTVANRSGVSGTVDTTSVATVSPLSVPSGLAIDASNNLYIGLNGLGAILRVTPEGDLVHVAGTFTQGYDEGGGDPRAAQLGSVGGLIFDLDGNLLIADGNNGRIRRINAGVDGVVSFDDTIETIAGGGVNAGDGFTALQTQFGSIDGLVVGPSGHIYLVDDTACQLRRIEAGTNVVTTLSGCGACSSGLIPDGYIGPMSVDAQERLYVAITVTGSGTCQHATGTHVSGFDPADGSWHRIFTNASSTAALGQAGNAYLGHTDGDEIYLRNALGEKTTLVGDAATTGFAGDHVDLLDLGNLPNNSAARVDGPSHMVMSTAGDLYFTDAGNHAVRMLKAPDSELAVDVLSAATLNGDGLSASPFTVLPADPWLIEIQRNGAPLVGNFTVSFDAATAGARLNDGVDSSASLSRTLGTPAVGQAQALLHASWATAATNLFTAGIPGRFGDYVPGTDVNLSLTVTPPVAGTILTFVNDAYVAGIAVGELSTETRLQLNNFHAAGMVFYGDDLIFTDGSNHRILRVTPGGGISVLVGGSGYNGDAAAPLSEGRLRLPTGLALDGDLLYVADFQNDRIRMIDLVAETIQTIAGGGPAGSEGQDGAALFIELSAPKGVAVGPSGELYIVETGNTTIRRIDNPTDAIPILSTYASPSVGCNASFRDGIAVMSDGRVFVSAFYPNCDGSGASSFRLVELHGGSSATFWGGTNQLNAIFDMHAEGTDLLLANGNNHNALYGFAGATNTFTRLAGVNTATGCALENPDTVDVPGGDDGCVRQPVGITQAPDGTIYFADSVNQTIRALYP